MSVFGTTVRTIFLAVAFCSVALADGHPRKLSIAADQRMSRTSDTLLVAAHDLERLTIPQIGPRRPHLAPLDSATSPDPESFGQKAPSIRLLPANKSANLAPIQLSSLAPSAPDNSESISPPTEPFNLPTVAALAGDVSTKWSALQSRILNDEKTLAACRSGATRCPKAARRFLSIVELGRKHQGRSRLGWINRAVNLSIRPTSDWTQYGYADYWASPLQTLESSAGDCEDYAIAKYGILYELGTSPRNLRLVIVQDNMRQAEHAVLAVRDQDKWLILDNRTMVLLDAEQERQYIPLFVMDYRGAREFSDVVARR